MGLQGDQAIPKRVSINTTPILGEDGSQRGALATFDNLTVLERKHAQLRKVLSRLRQSRRVVRRQNHELKALATRDPLTGCYNRRTLFAEFEKHWEACKRFERTLGCVMVDVDHFKSINDRFGHSVGDDVLKGVAETLRKTARKGDLVCRYGGEEFCVLLPHADIVEAGLAAERFRMALAAQPLGGVPVTASLGASALGQGAKSPQELIEQADKALYAAKRSGRNRIMRFDEAPPELMHNSKELKKPEAHDQKGDDRAAMPVDDPLSIPFQAVSGLLAALTYRHAETAEHCKRVADLCVTAGAGLMSQKDLYVVEMAALLHDIGKLGIPDNVLLKADALTAEEWNLLRMHQSIGVEIIRAAFTAEEMADIVRLRHCWYGGSPTDATMPRGPKIPAGARLLAIADAFDSMVHDQVYRKAKPREDAFAELRRCAGTQFDPILVEHFIGALTGAQPARSHRAPPPIAISKQAAFKIGVQIEKLAMAADVQDVASLGAMAGQLKAMAQECNIPAIAEVAGQLEQSASAKSNQMDLMELTIDLLELCRQTQRSLLPAGRSRKARPKTLSNGEQDSDGQLGVTTMLKSAARRGPETPRPPSGP
jgi:diguanylate cyclase (GGDEF)-like protein/putative nucleotidyltransferase with HDIG domain